MNMLKYLIYIPFVGWIIPFYLKKDDDLIYYHAKNSMIMAFLFAITLINLQFLTVFVPNNFKLLKLSIIILIYILYLIYLIFIIISVSGIKSDKKNRIFFISNLADKLNV